MNRLLGRWLLVLLAAGCGARTGLDEPPLERLDATGPPPFDAGTFTTFPCRWTLGVAAELGPGAPLAELAGAVHPTRDEAVVVVSGAPVERPGAVVSIAASGGVLERVESPRAALFAADVGYALQAPGACGVELRDARFTPTGRAGWDGVSCALTQSVVGRVESVDSTGAVRTLTGLDGTTVDRLVATTGPAPDDVFAFHDEATDTTLIARLDGRRLRLERHVDGRVEPFDVSVAADGMSAAADPLRGGMMVHYRDAADGWRLEHFDWEAGRWPETHFDVSGLPEPAGPIATNETEILVPLVDGRIAYIPFALVTLMVRWVDPVDGGDVERMHIVLRPNGSAGGVVYENRGAVWFQPLVCNR